MFGASKRRIQDLERKLKTVTPSSSFRMRTSQTTRGVTMTPTARVSSVVRSSSTVPRWG